MMSSKRSWINCLLEWPSSRIVHVGRDSGVEIKEVDGGILSLIVGFVVILSHFSSHIASGKVLWDLQYFQQQPFLGTVN